MACQEDTSHSDSDGDWVKADRIDMSTNNAVSTLLETKSEASLTREAGHGNPAMPQGCSTSEEHDMQLTLRPHVESVPLGESSKVLGMASLRVPGIGNTPRLSQLDVVAVIDRSGSMRGQRIDLVRKALGFMSKQLRSGDRLAIVSYADNAWVDLPLRTMDEKGQLECSQALESMTANGGTNLGEGLLWGLGELASSEAPAAALFLFTDGLANRGMTKTEALVEAMQSPMADMGRQSRAVFSFGLGTDHNAQMLFSLADAGTGCYYYVDTAQAIAPSFADCLGGMLSVAAQDVMLTLRAKDGVYISNVYADFNVDMIENNTEARIKMRDLSGDAEKEVLFDIALPPLHSASQNLPLVVCTLSYIDVSDGIAKTQKNTLALGVSSGKRCSKPDATVEAHRCRLLAAGAMEQAAGLLSKRTEVSQVRAILSDALDVLEKSPARTTTEKAGQEQIAALITDLSECLECTSDPSSCEKLCSSRAFAHKHQISTRAEGSAYRNALQISLVEAARREICCTLDGEESQNLRQSLGKGARFQPKSRVTARMNAANANSNTDRIPAGAVRAGMRVFCRGQPGKVQEVALSKTGKHGHAKAFFTVLCDDGVVRQCVVPSSDEIELAPEM